MKVNPVGSNMIEIELKDGTGTRVLFSYKTPVACHVPREGFYKTSKKWSVTTSKHINKWIDSHGVSGAVEAVEKEQEYFDKLGE